MTVGELIHSVEKQAVLATLAFTYQGEGEDPEGYSEVWDTLLAMQPKATTMSCILSPSEHGVDVSGIEADDPTTHYAIEFVEWAQWLSMPVIVNDDLGSMSPVEQLAHILYELTWAGYDPETQQEHLQEINDSYEDALEQENKKLN